jgi:HSP20 family protein
VKLTMVRRRGSSTPGAGRFSQVPAPGGSSAFFQYCPVESWRPPVNLYESEDCYYVCVDLAGMSREAIDVSLRDNVLVISGAREHPRPIQDCGDLSIHLMEIDQGPFCRSVEIPTEVDLTLIRATYTSTGYLWIELPKGRG